MSSRKSPGLASLGRCGTTYEGAVHGREIPWHSFDREKNQVTWFSCLLEKIFVGFGWMNLTGIFFKAADINHVFVDTPFSANHDDAKKQVSIRKMFVVFFIRLVKFYDWNTIEKDRWIQFMLRYILATPMIPSILGPALGGGATTPPDVGKISNKKKIHPCRCFRFLESKESWIITQQKAGQPIYIYI